MKTNLSQAEIKKFQKKIWSFYKTNRRDFPWRETRNPYRILVSEVMLQQTQTERVREKYRLFIKTFPSIKKLSTASLEEVLRVWQGLGYNRRARFLLEAARKIISDYNGRLPKEELLLAKLPGIGKATAGSVAAFAFNAPSIFIETNIRRVFIHEFFPKKKNVPDEDVRKLIASTLSSGKAREWYYALMDYGAHLGKNLKQNPNLLSRHYKKQSVFEGSRRKVRGQIIKLLLEKGKLTKKTLSDYSRADGALLLGALESLKKEEIIRQRGAIYELMDR